MYNIFMHIKFTTRVSHKVFTYITQIVQKKPGRILHKTSVNKAFPRKKKISIINPRDHKFSNFRQIYLIISSFSSHDRKSLKKLARSH